MNPIDNLMKVLVTNTKDGIKINLLLSEQTIKTLQDAVSISDEMTPSACIVRKFEDSNTGIAEICLEVCKPELKGLTRYADVVKDPESVYLLVTTL